MKGYAFGREPWFELLPDGTVYARAGTQTNCGGIASIHALITVSPSGVTEFTVAEDKRSGSDEYGFAVPGAAVPESYREAIYAAVREALEDLRPGLAVRFELIDALVHEVDARTSKFGVAGYSAMAGWLDAYESQTVP